MTQIEKEAFLGNYIGCEIEWLRESDNTWITTFLTASDFMVLVKRNCRLIAKPLESITDEDAIELFDLLVPKHTDDDKEIKLKNVKRWIDKDGDEHLLEHAGTIIDFLRSKGYLLPFRQYSTEQLIESGIVKI